MHTATDQEENVYELKFGRLNFDEVQSLTQDEMLFLLSKKKDAIKNTSQYVQIHHFPILLQMHQA